MMHGMLETTRIVENGLSVVMCFSATLCKSVFQIHYRVVRDIEPGEELLLFMKTEDYSHDTMAPDIHGQ